MHICYPAENLQVLPSAFWICINHRNLLSGDRLPPIHPIREGHKGKDTQAFISPQNQSKCNVPENAL